jgi:hypothetical protein
MPESAFKKMREEEGKKAERRLAKEAGYESVEEYREAVKALKTRPSANRAPPTTPPAQPDNRTPKPGDKDTNRLRRDMDRMKQSLAQENKQRRLAERELYATQAEMALRDVAYQEGVKDADYAIRLYTRSLEGKTEEECNKSDERTFFRELKKSHPYLYGERTVPATTGVNASPPPPPSPTDVNRNVVDVGKVDARRMNDQQFAEHLKKLGIRKYA